MQSRELQELIRVIPPNFADPTADFQAVRTMLAPFHGHPTGSDFAVSMKSFGGIPCGDYSLELKENNVTVFHCHGGAFVSTPVSEYHFYAEIIARHVGCRVVMPDYRLAPEHPYPAAIEDCFDAYQGLLANGVPASRIALLGESCGGSLALSLLQRLREQALPMPACFVSLTGWFDLAVAKVPSYGKDPFLTAEWVRNRGREYLGQQLLLDDPRVSPVYAELQGLPPMYLQIGQYDTMSEGALTLGSKALNAGVAVTMESWPGMIHGWHGLVNADVPEATAAWTAIADYIAQLCAQ